MREEDRYFDLMEKLEARLNGNTEEDNFRRMAREEANKRIEAYLVPLAALAAGGFVATHYGKFWFLCFMAAAVAWFVWTTMRQANTKEHERHLVGLYSQDICRLDRLQAHHAAGERVWTLEETPRREVIAMDGTHWEGWWRGVYEKAQELEKLTANQRQRQMRDSAKAALPMLEAGESMASQTKAELVFWAITALQAARK